MSNSAAPAFDVKRDMFKLFILPALWLLAVPSCSLVFANYGEHKIDQQILEQINAHIDRDDQISAEDKPVAKNFYQANPPSSVCGSDAPQLQGYRDNVCGTGADLWQFEQARRVAKVATVMGIAAILGALGLGLLAFVNRRAQYVAFVVGWRGLTVVSVLQVVMQAALATWMSFWVTALLFHFYSLKLILIVALAAAAAVFIALAGILGKVPEGGTLEAELVHDGDAPGLWNRLRQLATRLGTAPPDHVLAGIDDNFFVTESALRVAGKKLSGRSLYISLPLLRVLEASEADAVLAHELGHFKGGDTAASAKLGPKLVKFDQYTQTLANGGTTLPAFYLMNMFRGIFELALRKESREREFEADRVAAALTSPKDLGRSLLKVAGYSRFRLKIEQTLFETDQKHTGALDIGHRVENGLAQFVTSPGFKEQVTEAIIPHPFDSHPPLAERLVNVKSDLKVENATQVFDEKPVSTWVEQILIAEQIEGRLWAAYEQRFQTAHQQSLAYRYLPSNDEERALVEQFFPPVSFILKGGEAKLTYAALTFAEHAPLKLEDISDARIHDGNFHSELVLTHHETGERANPLSIKLSSSDVAFKDAFGRYWGRAMTVKQIATK